jgi:hypothetical protein
MLAGKEVEDYGLIYLYRSMTGKEGFLVMLHSVSLKCSSMFPAL